MNAEYLHSYANAGLFMMQGRLSTPEDGRFQSFPRTQWKTEIALAPDVPLRGIEWIYDAYGEGANPLETPAGRLEFRDLLSQSNIQVVSICADYFMDYPLVRIASETLVQRLEKLRWLISICPSMGITRIVLPFVDASKITNAEDRETVILALHQVLPQAEESAVELHLETDLSPANFRSLLDQIPHPLVKVNYDSGNSAALGYPPLDEFAAYGDRVGSFHIKDRLLGGGTVPLGRGNVDFKSLRQALLEIEYRGDFVMQIARGITGQELGWVQQSASVASGWLRGEQGII
jgi:hexulose-6-phosphate isomerase